MQPGNQRAAYVSVADNSHPAIVQQTFKHTVTVGNGGKNVFDNRVRIGSRRVRKTYTPATQVVPVDMFQATGRRADKPHTAALKQAGMHRRDRSHQQGIRLCDPLCAELSAAKALHTKRRAEGRFHLRNILIRQNEHAHGPSLPVLNCR